MLVFIWISIYLSVYLTCHFLQCIPLCLWILSNKSAYNEGIGLVVVSVLVKWLKHHSLHLRVFSASSLIHTFPLFFSLSPLSLSLSLSLLSVSLCLSPPWYPSCKGAIDWRPIPTDVYWWLWGEGTVFLSSPRLFFWRPLPPLPFSPPPLSDSSGSLQLLAVPPPPAPASVPSRPSPPAPATIS